MDAMAHTFRESGARVLVEDLTVLTTDSAAMGQIIGNLLSNSIKYLQPQRPGVITISGQSDSRLKQVILEIKDNGRGISEQDIHKIFSLFQRVGKQDQPGEGMGLSYVRTLVTRLGGKITCQSILGQGSTFTVIFPMDPPRNNHHEERNTR